ncbi:MAG: type III-B CRISPR module RAMP protein Cmr4 [Ignavibacteriales bacterium]|nr:type III-B CRISPR module RAMP protein Cmr4 [Ignavibacteriales bacterium]
MSYKTDAYLTTCLTNMHVGSGEANYGVVDNLVQRDSITDVPIIHSSSLKGALREFFKDEWKTGTDKDKLNYIFGPDTSRDPGTPNGIGHYKFFEANLVVLPVRSNTKPFYRATADFILKEVNEKAKALGITFNINPFNQITVMGGIPKVSDNNRPMLEDYQAENGLSFIPTITNHLGNDPALFHEDDFKELVKHLPVIARNQLENGESKNLWYEEVVPRESRFVFFVTKSDQYQTEFDELIQKQTIQIGGNASIGYGYTKIEKLS